MRGIFEQSDTGVRDSSLESSCRDVDDAARFVLEPSFGKCSPPDYFRSSLQYLEKADSQHHAVLIKLFGDSVVLMFVVATTF
jgi:hypothetical protein